MNKTPLKRNLRWPMIVVGLLLGHITIMALEGIARRDFSMQVKEKMLLAGFVVLMMLMVTVIYNDLTRISWLERLMPWRN